VGLLSDPHGDQLALIAGIDALRASGCEEVWCLGDLVGLPDPVPAIRAARDACEVVIAGNHDLLAAQRLSEDYVKSHGPEAIRQIRRLLTATELNYLKKLPTSHRAGDLQVAHACLDHPTDHVTDYLDANNQLALADCAFLALGHSHRAFCLTEDGRWLNEPYGEQKVGASGLVCPGSIRPTPARPNGTACVLDTMAGTCVWLVVGAPRGLPPTAMSEART
jgi:predicted phosphodiesterase